MKNFNDLVNKQMVESIKSHDKLSNAVYAFLHLNKEKHNVWVVTKQKQLTLLTDNPYLATQLRYQQQNICLHLNKKFLMQLNVIKVKIVPPKGVREVIEESNFTISERTEGVLADIAGDIDDEGLKNSLLKLANKYKTGNRAKRDNVGAERRLPEGRDCKSSKKKGGVL